MYYPCLLAKGPTNELLVNDSSATQVIIFDKYLQFSHSIGGAGSGKGKFQCITGIYSSRQVGIFVCHR